MTCIVGLVHKGTVYMGGDSAGVGGYSLTVRKDTKVFHNASFLMGFTSSFRMGQLLRYAFSPPDYDSSVSLEKFMATTFIDAVRACLKEGGFASKSSEVEAGGYFLVGFQGRLFYIESDYQVGEALDGYDAVGCGSDVALGALYATSARVTPRKRILLALQAAERHNAGVRAPFTVEAL